MRILMFYGGGDTGGGKTHILSLAKKLSESIDLKLVSFRNGEFAKEAIEMGLDTVVVDHRRGFSYARKEAIRICDEFGPDLVHTHGSKANLLGTIVKRKRGVPLVTTVHSDPKLDYMGKPLRKYTYGLLNAIALRQMDYYVAVAGRMKLLLVERGFDPSKVFTVFNGMDFAGSTDCPRPEKGENEIINLGIAARLDPVKDIDTLIKAFALAYKEDSRLRLRIAGSGDCEESLRALANGLGVGDVVYFDGWVSDIKGFFKNIDINVLSSLSETFPYSLLEGAYEHCPAIASNAGGIPYLIEHEKTGLLFECGDAETFSKHILRLASDAGLRTRLAENLRERAKNVYSLDRMGEDQKEIYRTVIRRSAKKDSRNGVILCGAYGMGNAGDEAILKAVIEELHGIDPDISIYVMSRTPKETKLTNLCNSFFTFNPFAFVSAAKKSKLLISGGGSLMQDVTSTRSLWFYLLVIQAAKMLGCKVSMYGCGIGPILGESHKRQVAKIINRYVDVISLRDSMSKALLDEIGVKNVPVMVSADPTFSLPKASDSAIDKAFTEEGMPADLKMLGLSLRSWKSFNQPEKIAQFAQYAHEKYGLTPVFVPIEMPHDVDICEQVSALINPEIKSYVLRNIHRDAELIGMLRRMDVVCGMRLHSLIFATCAGTPAIGVSYDVKVDGFLKDCGTNFCMPVEDIDLDRLKGYLDECMSGGKKRGALIRDSFAEAERNNIQSIKALLA